MLGSIDSVSFRITNPAFGHCAEGIDLGRGLRAFFDGLNALDLKTEVMDPPRERVRVDQGEIHKTVRETDRAVGSPIFSSILKIFL